MGNEIERKFLVKDHTVWQERKGILYRQGYLSRVMERVARVRTANNKGYLTVKGPRANISRLEFEYEIPLEDANRMLDELCEKPLIEKTRYLVVYPGLTWEIDVFLGENEGLVVAEVELKSEDQTFQKPDWAGNEVSDDSRYFNSNLMHHPFSKW